MQSVEAIEAKHLQTDSNRSVLRKIVGCVIACRLRGSLSSSY